MTRLEQKMKKAAEHLRNVAKTRWGDTAFASVELQFRAYSFEGPVNPVFAVSVFEGTRPVDYKHCELGDDLAACVAEVKAKMREEEGDE